MNPSALGWIKKLLKNLKESSLKDLEPLVFYKQLKDTGFIYGSNVSLVDPSLSLPDLSEEERCKINLLSTFYYAHQQLKSTRNFVQSVIDFYASVDEQKRSVLDGLFGEEKSEGLLEKIIHKRIHIDDNFITKNFNYFLINALLFTDILGYIYYLKGGTNTKKYLNTFESALDTIVFTVLESKTDKTDYDYNLIKLFENSLRTKSDIKLNCFEVTKNITTPLEKRYIIDIVCMASWSDQYIDRNEYAYLSQLKSDLDIKTETLIQAIDDINLFYRAHRKDIAFLSSKNLAQSFYDNSSKLVTRLIKRNAKRLIKELSQSKEAMILLTQSTQRNLSEEEQKKIQNQLFDIFKSIPSLAIFMLPGGMLLMPLFVKFIPKLLPSAFDDNRIED